MTPPDLTDRLTRSLGEEPPAPPLADTVVAGRRALARRRAGAAGGAAAVLLVVAGSAVLVSGGGDAQRATTPADQPTSAPTAPPSVAPTPAPERPSDGADLELTAQGELRIAPDVVVSRQVDNPLDYAAPDRSLGVVYRKDGATTWALLTNTKAARGRATSISTDPARKAFATFDAWLADQVGLQDGAPTTQADLVTFAADGSLVPGTGVEILDQDLTPELGDSFAGPGDPTAAVEVRVDGRRLYLVARQIGTGPAENITTDVAVGGPTLADFVAYAQAQYAGGEGLR